MRINLLASAIGASLYSLASFGAAASLAPNSADNVHTLASPNFSQEQIKNMQTNSGSVQTTMLENDGLNVQINSQADKFVEEEGLSGEHVYAVRLKQQPVSLYKGGITGFPGTHINSLKQDAGINKLYKGKKPTIERVTQYQNYLISAQDKAITAMTAAVGNKQVRKQFTIAINAYTVSMTQEEAKRVSELGEVAFVQRAKTYEIQSDAGPKRIGAEQVWTGDATGVELKGEGIIVGIIDTGVNTDHVSFADIGDDGYDHTNPWGEGVYVGACAEEGQASLCNDKLIGVRSYREITDAFDEMSPGWPAIGEDFNGHGSHVASTAAGNVLFDVDYKIADASQSDSDGILIKENLFPQISGVAPHANVVSYQVCHATNDSGIRGCPWEAMMSGIEDAITDGVDVINFSIGGQESSPWQDGVEMAFFAAREAGISVAAAAGNAGKACGQECFGAIDHASPWLLSVAATTHDREIVVETHVGYAGFANDESGTALGSELPRWSETGFDGGAINTEELTGVVVWAKDYADVDGYKDWQAHCATPYPADTFNFYKDGSPIVGAAEGTTNVIVVCKRNDLKDPNAVARTAKVANVKAGGADGFIMYNHADGDSIPVAGYELPSAHISYTTWNASAENNYYGLRSWIDSWNEKGHMLTIGKTVIEARSDAEKADWLADFSSRGASFSTPEMLIPQVSAPGVNVYAAYSDQQPFTSTPQSTDFNAISGTSMASPHVAGAMALIRQAHPDWSATEVQSALALTADNVVQYRRLNQINGTVGKASTYRAGAGRINVANAIDTGLIMDETAANFLAADPNNGGAVHRLNMPQLVNFDCKPSCQWVRTVKATKDGSWKVTNSDVINWNKDMLEQMSQNGVTIKVTPSEFNLVAGETQNIVIEASIMDTQDWYSDGEIELHTDLIFDEVNGASPQAHIPVAFEYDNNNMPSKLEVVAHRNNASYQLNNLPLPEVEAPFGRVFTPVKADVKTVSLLKDDERTFPWTSDFDADITDVADILDEATQVEFIEVPANSKRLMVGSLGLVASDLLGTENSAQKGNLVVYVGKDYNGNGEADMQEEILCVSTHIAFDNYCNINDPDEGTYWAVLYNAGQFYRGQPAYPDLAAEEFSYAVTLVTDEVSADLTMTVEPSNGNDTVNAIVSWDIPEMAKDDIYYSVVDFGTSEMNAGNIGKIAFKLVRGQDDVSLDVTQDSAKLGDIIPFTFEVLPNDTGADRAFTISATMPETGMLFSAEDVLASSSAVENISVEGNVITVTGTQPDTGSVNPHYNMTTNITDAMCKTPNIGSENPGGYIDLEEFNIYPYFSGFNTGVDADGNETGDNMIMSSTGIQIPVVNFFSGYQDTFHLYDNQTAGANIIDIRANGVIDLMGQPFYYPYHYEFPFYGAPFEAVGMFWRGITSNRKYDLMSVPLSQPGEENAGISIAYTTSGLGIIEFDNARTYNYAGQDRSKPNRPLIWDEMGDSYDFELIFNTNTRYGDNEYELFMAYDNIDFADQGGRGSIGVKGFKGPLGPYGPMLDSLGEQFAFDDLDEKITDGLVVCYDYVGPESSQFEVTIWTKVQRSAAGQDLNISATSSVEGMADFVMERTISVPSHISLPAIADQEVDEDSSLDIKVYYADDEELKGVNQITVSGDNIVGFTQVVEAGSSVTITPNADFDGETMVTITVADLENPTDAASTSFMLTVNSDGVDEVAEAAAAAAAEAAAKAAEEDSNSSGGSTGMFMLTLLALFGLRRQISAMK